MRKEVGKSSRVYEVHHRQRFGVLRTPYDCARKPGLAVLARRIADWTSKGILTAVILIAGVTFAREVLRWWAADEVVAGRLPSAGAVADGLGEPGLPHQLQFGDQSWTLERRLVAGSSRLAAEALRASCLRLTRTASLPSDEPSSAEMDFLKTICRRKPAAEESGDWQLYELDSPFPMAVGVRTCTAMRDNKSDGNIAAMGRRVVTWGVAAPTADGVWTLFTFYSGGSGKAPPGGLTEVPVPPESRRSLSIRVVGGAGVVAFRGEQFANVEQWQNFFDQWFRQKAWKVAAGWRHRGRTSYARFIPDNGTDNGSHKGSVDVQFGTDRHGKTGGLLVISPPDKRTTGSQFQ